MGGYRSPEDAVRAEDAVPAEYPRVITVQYAPDGAHAVDFMAYNEPPATEPHVVLCEKTPEGWCERYAGSGGGMSWMGTADDGSVGVLTTWEPPSAQWDVPARNEPEDDPSSDNW